MLRKLVLTVSLFGLLGTAYALAPVSATDLATAGTDAVPVVNQVFSNAPVDGSRG